MIDEILLSKATSIDRCIERVREEYLGHEDELATNYSRQDAIVLNVQRACEQAIDMANRMIRLRRLSYPKDSRDSFIRLRENGVLDAGVTQAMVAMVGFRNVAVHEYRKLDIEKLRRIIEHGLDDLVAFSNALLQAAAK